MYQICHIIQGWNTFETFLKLQGMGAPRTPWGWMGVDGMDLDHNIIQNIHINIFLMRGQIFF